MPTILVVRAREDADALALRLGKEGYNCITDPLLIIEASRFSRPDMTGLQAAIVTSAHTAQILHEQQVPGQLQALPFYAVGDKTAASLEGLGIDRIINAGGDGAALAGLIAAERNPGKGALLHIVGDHTAAEPAAGLQTAGFTVRAWEVYRAKVAEELNAKTRKLLKQGKIDAVLLYSPRSAGVFADLIGRASLEDACRSMLAVTLSPAVSKAAGAVPWREIVAAAHPDTESLLTALKNACPAAAKPAAGKSSSGTAAAERKNEERVTQPEKPAAPPATPPRKQATRSGGAFIAFLALLIALAALTQPLWMPLLPAGLLRITGLGDERGAEDSEAMQRIVEKNEALAARMDDLERQLTAAAKETNEQDGDAELAALRATIAALEAGLQKVAATASQGGETGTRAVTIAYLRLREAAAMAAPFTAALESFCAAAGKDTDAIAADCEKLGDAAASGAATLPMLQTRLTALAASALTSARQERAASWWERIGAGLQALVSVRKLGEGGEGDERTLYDMQAALQRGDIAGALHLAKTLPETAQKDIAPWLADAQARLLIDEKINTLGDMLGGAATLAATSPAAEETPAAEGPAP